MTDDGKTLNDFMPDAPEDGADVVGRAGEPLPEGAAVADEDAVVAALRTVHDPELPVNLYDLGLIYRIEPGARGAVAIDMTLTAPGCPVAHEMPQMVADAVAGVDGVGAVTVRLVWDPPWSPNRMSEAAKLELGLV